MRVFHQMLLLALCFVGSTIKAQLPEITASDKLSPIVLQTLTIDVRIAGARATTTMTMRFFNPADRILAGTFALPLPDGANVIRYALDINGKMREAVPVEKAQATAVFESVQRRRIDPGLLEKTTGNIYRTRIFPLPAKGTREIILAFEQELNYLDSSMLDFSLALAGKDTLDACTIRIQVLDTSQQVQWIKKPFADLQWIKQGNQFQAEQTKLRVVLQQSLAVRLVPRAFRKYAWIESKENKHYFMVQASVPAHHRPRKQSSTLAIIWDISLSGTNRNTKQEIDLLRQYLSVIPTGTVELYTLNHSFQRIGRFLIQRGKADQLIHALEKMVYDGGTDWSACILPNQPEVLIFSDGLNTLSHATPKPGRGLVYTIHSSPKADFGVLRSLAEPQGGSMIDLGKLSIDQALQLLRNESFRFMGIKPNQLVREYYPKQAVLTSHGITVAGVAKQPGTILTLQFGYGQTVTREYTVAPTSVNNRAKNWQLDRVFAQLKINALDVEYPKHQQTILALGQQYGIVTRKTSLLVLEDVRDYVRYRIEPPAELLADYKQLVADQREDAVEAQYDTRESAQSYADSLWIWYNDKPLNSKKTKQATASNFTPPRVVHDSVVAVHASGASNLSAPTPPVPPPVAPTTYDVNEDDTSRVVRRQLTGAISSVTTQELTGRVAGVNLEEVVVVGYGSSPVQLRGSSSLAANESPLIVVDGVITNRMPAQDSIKQVDVLADRTAAAIYGSRAANGVVLVQTVNGTSAKDSLEKILKQVDSSVYAVALQSAKPNDIYQVYLQWRDRERLNPTFYYQVAEALLPHDRLKGLQVLSNLAELDYENHELYKLYGHKLLALGETKYLPYLFGKVKVWRPLEPQSHRDYALALMAVGRKQEAFDSLYASIIRLYPKDVMDNFEGIEETVITELSNWYHRYGLQNKGHKIPRSWLRPMPVDMRVLLHWNMNDVDIDLWVTDPSGEKCYYKNQLTKQGGRLSDDFTEGYGPEQFLIKRAKKGKYRIEVHYYGNSQAKIAGKTTLFVDVFRQYGRPNESRQSFTIQLEEEEREGVFVGEIIL